MRPKAKRCLADILKALDAAEVGRDISKEEWREILEEVGSAVEIRIDCLNEEELA
jgi:hypothetical protein